MKSKEERFIELMGDYKVEIYCNDFPNTIVYRNMNHGWLIWHVQKSEYTYIRWSLIWSIFQREYNMEYDEIQSFMKDILFKHLKIKETTPQCFEYADFEDVVDTLIN